VALPRRTVLISFQADNAGHLWFTQPMHAWVIKNSGLTLMLFLLGLNAIAQRVEDKIGPAPDIRNLAVIEFEQLRGLTNHVVLDVRTRREYLGGHVPGALLLDANHAQFQGNLKKLDRSKTYLVHCAAGVRSDRATRLMAEMGFTNLLHLPGGYRAWEKAGHKPEKGEPPTPTEPAATGESPSPAK